MQIKELIEKFIDGLEDRADRKYTATGIMTGFARIDQLISGFQNSSLITICGVSGIGKRAFAYNLMRNVSIGGNTNVCILNLSLSLEEMSLRLLCQEAMVDSSRIKSGYLSREDWDKLTNAVGILIDSNITIINKLDSLKDYDCNLLIVDSFQRLPSYGTAANITHEQNSYKLANKLKNIALSKNIPVIVLSSLNDWQIGQRSDKRPRLTDFKYGYSALPDISDVVISIYRDEIYNTDENNPNRDTAEITILKQRCGPTGTAILTFTKEYCRFGNMT